MTPDGLLSRGDAQLDLNFSQLLGFSTTDSAVHASRLPFVTVEIVAVVVLAFVKPSTSHVESMVGGTV